MLKFIEIEVFPAFFPSLRRSMLLSFMLGAPKVIFPLILGAPMPALYLPLLGAPMLLFTFIEGALVLFRGKKWSFEILLEGG